MNEELKPCPFCGGEAYTDDPGETNDFGVSCNTCGAFVVFGTDGETQTKAEAAKAWNRRTNDSGNEYVRPIPCVRDEHGEMEARMVKQFFAKINEELDELKAIALVGVCIDERANKVEHRYKEHIAEEAADTITAITTMLEALGIDEAMRDEAQRRVNEKNRERGRL